MPMCRDYLLNVCRRASCKNAHTLLACKDKCHFHNCKFLHLSEDDMEQLKENIRPFNEAITQELDRLAVAIKLSIAAPLRDNYCTRLLTSLNKCITPCRDCSQSPIFPVHCSLCFLPLGASDECTFFRECLHLYCRLCHLRLKLDTSSALPKFQCAVCGNKSILHNVY